MLKTKDQIKEPDVSKVNIQPSGSPQSEKFFEKIQLTSEDRE